MTAARDAPGHHAPSAEDQLTITSQPTPNKQESLDTPAPFQVARFPIAPKPELPTVRLWADKRDPPGGTADLAEAEIEAAVAQRY
jgi:hypothetical protein